MNKLQYFILLALGFILIISIFLDNSYFTSTKTVQTHNYYTYIYQDALNILDMDCVRLSQQHTSCHTLVHQKLKNEEYKAHKIFTDKLYILKKINDSSGNYTTITILDIITKKIIKINKFDGFAINNIFEIQGDFYVNLYRYDNDSKFKSGIYILNMDTFELKFQEFNTYIGDQRPLNDVELIDHKSDIILVKNNQNEYFYVDIIHKKKVFLGKYIGYQDMNISLDTVFSSVDSNDLAALPYLSKFTTNRETIKIFSESNLESKDLRYIKNDVYYATVYKNLEDHINLFGIKKYDKDKFLLSDDKYSFEVITPIRNLDYISIEKYTKTSVSDYTEQREYKYENKPRNQKLLIYDISQEKTVIEFDGYDLQ